jgi:LysM repeat protein
MSVERTDPVPVPVATQVDPAVIALRDICPFLLAADGSWRSAEATSEHRCTAVFPPAQLTMEKQRRLCLTPDHESCATFVAALAAREPATETVAAVMRPMPRTTPVVMERGRFAIPTHSLRPDRTAGQAALVILLGVAFVGILFAKLSSGSSPDGSLGALANPSASPSASPAVSAPAKSPAPSQGVVAPSASPVSEPSPTPTKTLVPTEVSPPPSAVPSTYKVKRGDTLSGIAATFGTTWQVIAELNHIKDPSALKVGTILQLP